MQQSGDLVFANGHQPTSEGALKSPKNGRDGDAQKNNKVEQIAAIKAEISAIDALIARIPMAENLAPDVAMAAQVQRQKGLSHFEEQFYHLAIGRLTKRTNFIRLASLLLFFSLYASCLLLQHYNSDSYNLESSVIMSNVMASLPQNGFGSSLFNGGGPGSAGLLSSNDDFYAWFRESIVNGLFKDSICGDGVCDSPEEVKSVGRFGCRADCGKVPADTTVTIRVDLKTVMQRRFQDRVDLGEFDPGFRYNIFSKKFNDYVFEQPMEPSAVSVATFEALRTDSFELHLFQTNSLTQKISEQDIQLMYHFGEGTIPPRTAAIPWGYGDARELMAVSQYLTQKVQDYCLNRVGDLYDARITDPACADADLPYPQGFPNYFTPLGIGLQILRSYGITGDITVPTINEYGKKVLISLVRPDGASNVGAAVKYCGPLPPSNATVDKLPTGLDFVKLIRNRGATCSASARRSLAERLEGLHLHPKRQDAPELEDWPDVPDGMSRPPRAASPWKSRRLMQSGSGSLSMSLVDVGVDDRGFWKCYGGPNDVTKNPKCWGPDAQWYFDTYNLSHQYGFPGSLFAALEIKYDDLVPLFLADEAANATYYKYKFQKGRAPVLADVALQMRYTIDGQDQHYMEPHCRGVFVPPAKGVLAFEYNFKSRLRLWNSNVSQMRVWLCNTSLSNSPPMYVSVMNVSDELDAKGFDPLQAGPYVTINIPLIDELTAFGKKNMHERMCTVVWSVVDERCYSRSWIVVTPQSASRRRDDATQQAWFATITWLFVSNSRATRASYLITTDVNSQSFKNQFPTVDTTSAINTKVFSPGPLPRLTRTDPYSCLSHYDCDQGLFCSTVSMTTTASGFRGGGGPGPSGYGCDSCQYCLSDSTDPIDRFCPRDKCGAEAGSYPECVDATQMFSQFKCKTIYPLYMDRVPPVVRTSNEAEQIPLSNPNSTKRKARFITPYNQLIGSVILTQKRRTGTCILKNDSIASYSRLKEPQLGAVCRGKQVNAAPFGNDPIFIPSSSIFRGDLEPITFYNRYELDNSSLPYGFYPHTYDQRNRSMKNPKYVMASEADSFKVYFSERVTSVYAQRFVSFLEDGGFLDQNTEALTVEIPTMNSNINFISLFTFSFFWEGGGKITWDYQIKSFPIYQYEDATMTGRIFLEILLVIMLGVNCLSELTDIFRALRKFDVMSYFKDMWNVIDWVHFGLMWTCWSLWLSQVNMGRSLNMPAGFKILLYPAPETPARLIATNPEGEYDFLNFMNTLRTMGENLAMYNYLTSLCVLLFVLRLLKVADFQPRIALVTRTLGNAVLDLIHFITLYCTIMVGYAIAGVVLFGHQYEGFKTLSNSIFSLIIVMIAWDPSQWVQLNHSAPDWSFDIFIWSWIFLAMFILLNILLAILVEGYMGVKALTEEEGAPGLMGDLVDVLSHELRRLIRRLNPSYHFISDDELAHALGKKLGMRNESSLEKAMKDYHAMVLSGLMPVQLRSGEFMHNDVMQKLLTDLFPEKLKKRKPKVIVEEEEWEQEDKPAPPPPPPQEEEQDPRLNPTLRDLMLRYASTRGGKDLETENKEKIKHFTDLQVLVARKRVAQMQLKLLDPSASLTTDPPQELESLTLHVTIEQARNLPRMDVGAGVDVFCLMFLEGAPGLHRTEIRRGKSETDWVWDPELSRNFTWDLPRSSKLLAPDNKLVVLVYDKDQLTSDDLIGVIKIKMDDLKAGELYEWRKIVRPPDAPKKSFWFWDVPIGEIRLRVTLAERLADGRTVDEAMVLGEDEALPIPAQYVS